jgi:hypothetical protein
MLGVGIEKDDAALFSDGFGPAVVDVGGGMKTNARMTMILRGLRLFPESLPLRRCRRRAIWRVLSVHHRCRARAICATVQAVERARLS